jgi:outer membrane protein assembly factor BamB
MPASGRKRLLHEARSERQRVLLEMARRAAKAKHWQDAETAARQAAEIPLTARDRLHALLRAAQIWKDAGQSAQERAVWETILADEELKQIQVIDRNGRPASAAESAAARVGQAFQSDRPMAKPDLRAPPRADILSLPLFRTWHATLNRDEWVLNGWRESDPELLLTGSSRGQLACRSASTGEVRWRHLLPFAPDWAGSYAGMIVAAGEGGVAGLRRADGELLWYFPAPAPGRMFTALLDEVSVVRDPGTPEPLTAFRLVSGRLFFLQGQRRLFALDATTGTVLWDRWAPDGGFRLPAPQGCFSPCYHAGTETILIQTARQRWLLDAATGRLIHQAADSSELWPRSPLLLDERTLCVVPDPRHIELLDARTGQTLWTHTLTGGTTLSGEYPQVLGRGNALFLVKPANVGYFLQRLDCATGKPLWTKPVLLAARTVDLNTWTFDQEAVYGIEENALTARSLADGKVLWQHVLDGASGWQLRRVGDSLMIWPLPSAEDARFRFRSPLGAVQWKLGPLLAPESVFTVACRDPKTGQLVQRLNFRIESPARTIGRRRTISESGGRSLTVRTSSLLASADGPVVRIDSPQPLIAAGGGIWGLSGASDGKHRADAGH